MRRYVAKRRFIFIFDIRAVQANNSQYNHVKLNIMTVLGFAIYKGWSSS